MGYKKKQLDFLVTTVDFFSLTISYVLASVVYLLFYQNNIDFFYNSFWSTYVIFLLSLIGTLFFTIHKNRLFGKRTYIEEMFNVIKNNLFLLAFFSVLSFISKSSFDISRGVFLMTITFNIVIAFLMRVVLKKNSNRLFNKEKNRLLIVTTKKKASHLLEMQLLNDAINNSIVGFVLVDGNYVGEVISDIPVVASRDTLIDYARIGVVDDTLFYLHNGWWSKLKPEIEELQSMGLVVHLSVDLLNEFADFNHEINMVGDFPVLSCATTFHSDEMLIIKRGFDIIGGIVGSVVALLFMIVIGPIIKLESPGPILFKQRRVGKNGRYFDIYKFRSMGIDAEQRKKELMNQNEVDGHMFKITNDPRVTRIGKFIRATSIDELPQFFNVFKGDMSLVGTRPPTIEEFKLYKPHHKRRLSMKPGITGLWQVSGRSNITNFEEVVKLDLEYIDKHTIGLDLKIIAKTFVVVFAKVGSR